MFIPLGGITPNVHYIAQQSEQLPHSLHLSDKITSYKSSRFKLRTFNGLVVHSFGNVPLYMTSLAMYSYFQFY